MKKILLGIMVVLIGGVAIADVGSLVVFLGFPETIQSVQWGDTACSIAANSQLNANLSIADSSGTIIPFALTGGEWEHDTLPLAGINFPIQISIDSGVAQVNWNCN